MSVDTSFSMPYNGNPKIIDIILSDYRPYVSSFDGSLGFDGFGGGRELKMNKYFSLNDFKAIISQLDRHNIEFNYMIKNTKMLNRQFDPEYQQYYKDVLEQLCSCGVQVITLSNIHFVKWIRFEYDYRKIET